MRTHILYTGGTLGMVPTPDGLAPGADLTGWLDLGHRTRRNV